MRIIVIASLFILSIVSSRIVHAEPDLDAGPMHLDFKVDAPDRKAPVATGSMEMESMQKTRFEIEPGTDPSKLSLEFFSRIHHDGTVGVWVAYDEVGAHGEKVKWEPAMQGKRGTPLVATIRAGQVERTITVTVR